MRSSFLGEYFPTHSNWNARDRGVLERAPSGGGEDRTGVYRGAVDLLRVQLSCSGGSS